MVLLVSVQRTHSEQPILPWRVPIEGQGEGTAFWLGENLEWKVKLEADTSWTHASSSYKHLQCILSGFFISQTIAYGLRSFGEKIHVYSPNLGNLGLLRWAQVQWLWMRWSEVLQFIFPCTRDRNSSWCCRRADVMPDSYFGLKELRISLVAKPTLVSHMNLARLLRTCPLLWQEARALCAS